VTSRSIVAVAALMSGLGLAGCSSGPPKCSDPDVVGVLEEFLQEDTPLLAIALTSSSRLYTDVLFASAPGALVHMNNSEFGEAFKALEAGAAALPATGVGTLAKDALVAAKTSTFAISGVTTIDATDRRSSCKFHVDYVLGLPSEAQILAVLKDAGHTQRYVSMFDLVRNWKQDRTFEAYYADDGELFVELANPE
jgi:hypothetical protein